MSGVGTLYPLVSSQGSVTYPDGTTEPTNRCACPECGTYFIAIAADDCRAMWWDHLLNEHPNLWVLTRDYAPKATPS